MGALLALIPGKDMIYAAIILILLVAFGMYTVHERHAGAAHEMAALQASSDRLQKQTAAQTAELKARAVMAEQAYDKEHLLVVNQPIDSVRLCLNSNRGKILPATGTVVAGNAAPGAGPGSVLQVPAGDSGGGQRLGPDIGPMLDALAAAADNVSATLREFQTRGNH